MENFRIKIANFLRERPRLRMYYDILKFVKAAHAGESHECSICGYKGSFLPFGASPRLSAACPKCGSVERQRLVALWLSKYSGAVFDKNILHFAPEPSLSRYIRTLRPTRYLTADINVGRADISLNIENIELESNSFDYVICNHVLEHVNDNMALREIHRVLKPEGKVLLTVPIVLSWEHTYEPEGILTDADRVLHFGQKDHIRIYGQDFEERVRNAGFDVEKFVANGSDAVVYGLLRGETVFIGQKP